MTPWSDRAWAAAVGTPIALLLAACGQPGGSAPETGTAPRTVEADAIVSGVVTRNGEPAAGVEIVVLAWPNDEILDALAEGEPVPTRELARVHTDQDGWFVVTLDPADVGPDHTREGGDVDLDLWFDQESWPARQRALEFFFTATVNDSGRGGGTRASAHFDDADFSARAAEGRAPMHLLVEIGDEPSLVEEGSDVGYWR